MRRLLLLLAACGGESGPEPAFPADYAATYVEVRDCRPSADHDLNNIRVLADPAAMRAYVDRDVPFPRDAVVLKEEYDFADDACAGEVLQWTVMLRLDSPANLGWSWERVDEARAVVEQDEPRCIGCHTACGVPPDGYQGTCAIP